ncbi:MAG: acylphosphatase [Spirochaetales bacterium]|uniref:Acylphosphatase n=1 Tax=Candidatus Thalassospirochaeta sargassi TaxID=3119039 RepID=A0AAJ1MNE9_9SPIO|nr:acylphosphatase [Spirochaetales bacterium]
MTKALRINVTGRVQGVGFRYTAQQKASRLRLTGWVRNERDGSVEIRAEGEPEQLAALLDWLEAGGPPCSRISRIDHFPVEPQGTFSRFSVEY